MPPSDKRSRSAPSAPIGSLPDANFQGLLMTSFALPERLKSRRAKYPKVRTGCISCKKRHVKCDEAKPSCNRCLKWSGVCSGYAAPRSKSCPAEAKSTATKQAMKRPLLMRGSSNPEVSTYEDTGLFSPSISSSEPSTPPLMPPYHAVDPALDSSDAGSSEASILDATFWTDSVPHLVKENLAVRYANMAVHILILAKQPELIDESCSELGPDHYSQALAHYGLALRQMRQSVEGAGGLRAAVLCSMFFVIFEAINGDKDAAESHLLCGQRLLEELHQLSPLGAPVKGTGSLRKELRNLLQYISLQVRIGGINCWRGEIDNLYGESLGDYLSFESPPAIASPVLEGSPDPFMPVMWTEDFMF